MEEKKEVISACLLYIVQKVLTKIRRVGFLGFSHLLIVASDAFDDKTMAEQFQGDMWLNGLVLLSTSINH